MSKRIYEYLDNRDSDTESNDGKILKIAIICTLVIIGMIYILATYFL